MVTVDYDIKLSKREQAIMYDLYLYRVMTTAQIKIRHFENKGTYINKVLYQMRKKGYIKTNVLRNSREGKRGISYHRLTETGVLCLAKHEPSVEGQSTVYVKPTQAPYILLANELVVDLTDTEWEIWDSRRVKKEYNMDMRLNIQGMLITPEKHRYGLYVMNNHATAQTIGKIQSEIKINSKLGLSDYMIITQGVDSYKTFIKQAIEEIKDTGINKEPLMTGHAIKVYPYKTFITKAVSYMDKEAWVKKICDYYGYELKSTSISDGSRQSFPYIIEKDGKEYYFVDLTDSDLQKYHEIQSYVHSQSSRKWENRDILALALAIPSKTNRRLDSFPSVTLNTITQTELNMLCAK